MSIPTTALRGLAGRPHELTVAQAFDDEGLAASELRVPVPGGVRSNVTTRTRQLMRPQRWAGRPPRRFVEVLQCCEGSRYTDALRAEVRSARELTALIDLLNGAGLGPGLVSDSIETGARPSAIVQAAPAGKVLEVLEAAGWCVTWRRDLWMMPGHLVEPGTDVRSYDAQARTEEAA